MRPEAGVWRKAARAALKGASKGRRSTHPVVTQPPVRGSTWVRRHPGQRHSIPTRPEEQA